MAYIHVVDHTPHEPLLLLFDLNATNKVGQTPLAIEITDQNVNELL